MSVIAWAIGIGRTPLIIIGRLSALLNAELESITAVVLDALNRARAGDADVVPGPTALTFLLRRYLTSDRADLRDALGEALAPAFARADAETRTLECAAWLTLFAEASAISDDDRLPAAAAVIIADLRAAWPSIDVVELGMASVDACLCAADVVDPRELVPAAIDELERLVGRAYQPGDGIAHTVHSHAHARGNLGDHARSASALLTAFSISGRLPYSMLAEELMQTARQDLQRAGEFVARCVGCRVLCRLAALHADEAYRDAAVIAPDADYRADAERILVELSSDPLARESGAGEYGLALLALR
jgi:hypothetical protein